MSPLNILGVALSALVSIVIPLAGTVWLIRHNHVRRTSTRTNSAFWWLAGIYLVIVAFNVYLAIGGTLEYEGVGVVLVSIFALPLSVIPILVHANLMHLLFTDEEWAASGYLVVTCLYSAGMVLWAFCNAAGLRALVSLARRSRWR